MLSNAVSRSISAENFKGEKGKGGMVRMEPVPTAPGLGQGWKVSPCVHLKPGKLFTVAEIEGPGVIQHMDDSRRKGMEKLII